MPDKPNQEEPSLPEPSLLEQTMELGKVLRMVSERDPEGKPSETAAAVFRSWLTTAGPTSREPRYFADVAENYDIFDNTNKALFRLFELLNPYLEMPEEEEEESPGVFIGLPMA